MLLKITLFCLCLVVAHLGASCLAQGNADAGVSTTTTASTTTSSTTAVTTTAQAAAEGEVTSTLRGSTRTRKRAQLQKLRRQNLRLPLHRPVGTLSSQATNETGGEPVIRRCRDCQDMCSDKCQSNSEVRFLLKNF